MSAPASATRRIWAIVSARFAVSVLVIVWTATGAPPPIGTPPTWICRVNAISAAIVGPGPFPSGLPPRTRCGTRERRARHRDHPAARGARRRATPARPRGDRDPRRGRRRAHHDGEPRRQRAAGLPRRRARRLRLLRHPRA